MMLRTVRVSFKSGREYVLPNVVDIDVTNANVTFRCQTDDSDVSFAYKNRQLKDVSIVEEQSEPVPLNNDTILALLRG